LAQLQEQALQQGIRLLCIEQVPAGLLDIQGQYAAWGLKETLQLVLAAFADGIRQLPGDLLFE